MNYKRYIFLIVILGSFCARGQEFKYFLSDDSLVNHHASIKKIYTASRTTLKPRIDGYVEDECWHAAGKWEGGFIQKQPLQAQAPSQETQFKILYDDSYLYVAIICYDNEPDKIRNVLGRRDEIAGDIAGIAIDSYDDNQTAFEFNVTAAGQKIDLMHLGEEGWDYNWDAVWDGKAVVGDSAWFAEMRIPFNQLRFASNQEQVWGLHIWRWIDRLMEEDHWKLVPVDAPAMVYIFGELRGIEDINRRRNFELLPYAKAKYMPVNGNKGYKALYPGIGLDGKIGVTSDFTLDYTINPDFGQVEADPSELNLTSYEIFYNEKRPFFLEGNSILDYASDGDLLFYSRRIGAAPGYYPEAAEDERVEMPGQSSIINALKLTGKNRSGLSLGIINSMTSREKATITSGNSERKETVEPFTNYFIGRIKQDFNNGKSFLGAMGASTVRNIKDEHLDYLPGNSLTGGVDFQHNWLNRKYYIDTKSFFSRVNGSNEAISILQLDPRHLYQRKNAGHLTFNPDATHMQGWGGEIRGGKRSGKFRLTGSLNWRSPGIELNDVGYLRQADYLTQGLNMFYWVNKPVGLLNSYYIDLKQFHYRSFGGEKLGDELSGRIRLQFKNLWKLDFYGSRVFYTIDTRQLRGGPSLRIDGENTVQIFCQTNSSKNFFLGIGPMLRWNDDNISYTAYNSFYAQLLIKNRISLTSNTNVTFLTNNNQYVMQKVINNRQEYIVGTIKRKTLSTTFRAEVFLTPELSVQYYGNPYASVGKYKNYRKVDKSTSPDIESRFSPLFIESESGENLLVDKNHHFVRNLTASNPDFNFQEFRSNLVVRWEYQTGSTIYLVWTNDRFQQENHYEPSLFKSLHGMKDADARNVFMVKVNFWFSL